MTIISLYPLAAATEASPIPVFPEVGSIMTVPAFMSPRSSASFKIAFATLSLTEPAGLKYSSFAKIFAFKSSVFSIFVSSSSGVSPISPSAEV